MIKISLIKQTTDTKNLINWIDEISPDCEEKNTDKYTQEASAISESQHLLIMKANHTKLFFKDV